MINKSPKPLMYLIFLTEIQSFYYIFFLVFANLLLTPFFYKASKLAKLKLNRYLCPIGIKNIRFVKQALLVDTHHNAEES